VGPTYSSTSVFSFISPTRPRSDGLSSSCLGLFWSAQQHNSRLPPAPARRRSSPAPAPSRTASPARRSSAHNQPPQQQQSVQAQPPQAARPKRAGGADSMDWVASSLTRRFGICIGLAWAGFLAVGVVSEQLQTRFEVAQQQANTKSVLPCLTLACRSRAPQDVEQEQEVVLANGIRYYDLRVSRNFELFSEQFWLIPRLILMLLFGPVCRLKSQSAAGAQPRRPLAAAAGAQARG
jgi:hypothetical protein